MSEAHNDWGVRSSKRPRSRAYPGYDLSDSTDVARIVEEGGGALDYEVLARSMNLSPDGSTFRRRLAAAGYFGLVEQEEDVVHITTLGRQIVVPTSPAERQEALRQAFYQPSLFGELAERFGGRTLPPVDLFRNILQRQYGITASATPTAARVFLESGLVAGVLRKENDQIVWASEETPIQEEGFPPQVEPGTVRRPELPGITAERVRTTPDLTALRLEGQIEVIKRLPTFDANWSRENIEAVRDFFNQLLDRFELEKGIEDEQVRRKEESASEE